MRGNLHLYGDNGTQLPWLCGAVGPGRTLVRNVKSFNCIKSFMYLSKTTRPFFSFAFSLVQTRAKIQLALNYLQSIGNTQIPWVILNLNNKDKSSNASLVKKWSHLINTATQGSILFSSIKNSQAQREERSFLYFICVQLWIIES